MDSRELYVEVVEGSAVDSVVKGTRDISDVLLWVFIAVCVVSTAVLGWCTSTSLMEVVGCHYCDFVLEGSQVWSDFGHTCPDCLQRQPDLFSGSSVLYLNMLESGIALLLCLFLCSVMLVVFERFIFKRDLTAVRDNVFFSGKVVFMIWGFWYAFTEVFAMVRLLIMLFS